MTTVFYPLGRGCRRGFLHAALQHGLPGNQSSTFGGRQQHFLILSVLQLIRLIAPLKNTQSGRLIADRCRPGSFTFSQLTTGVSHVRNRM